MGEPYMENLDRPEREVLRPATSSWVRLLSVVGVMLLVVLLSFWILKVSAGAMAINSFRELVLTDRMQTRRSGVPLLNVFAGEEALVIYTTLAGPEENPAYRPQISRAQWAVRQNSWNADWLYDIALAYWQESERKRREVATIRERYAGLEPAAKVEQDRRIELLSGQMENLRRRAFDGLVQAWSQDPANGYYRQTLAELGEQLLTNDGEKSRLWKQAENGAPGDTVVLLLQGEHLQGEGKAEEALAAYRKVLSYVRSEFRHGLRDPEGKLLGPVYLGRAMAGLESILKTYDAYSEYIPDEAEVHLRVAWHLRGEATRATEQARVAARGSAERAALTARAEACRSAAASERQKGLKAGEVLVAEGKQTALILGLMSNAYEIEGDMSCAIRHLEQALELDPLQKSWWLRLTNYRFQVAETAAAEAKTESDKGNTSEARRLSSRAREYLNQAEESLDELFELEPAHAQVNDIRREINKSRERLR